ncbi:hypothetical protein DCAR_0622921 [Daucus carota subsp. sativus]|uniref:RNase H type-1 domain-containing protein n=1 Tax=Daucus carota subsp. sativus TaxID=79200 RepID=A0AAF0XAI0_DAUCS|nr:hypothetical protein DCAR_0622921 [Daucus carota subsp. sativus]
MAACFSLTSILRFYASPVRAKIWRVVVVATLWSIWLARNELIFNGTRLKKQQLIELIAVRINKWGNAAGLILFGDDPLWRVNPHGIIAVHHFKRTLGFWQFRVDNYDFVCAVDGAFGSQGEVSPKGGIGGYILNNRKEKILIFSGPVRAKSALQVETEGILQMLRWIFSLGLSKNRVLICTDSTESINIFNKGYAKVFPLRECNLDFQHLIGFNIFIQFVPSEINEEADLLAKNGIGRKEMSSWRGLLDGKN